MRRCSPELPCLVNAAIDSMGVVNHKGGVSTDLSPQQTVIEETKVAIRYCDLFSCYELVYASLLLYMEALNTQVDIKAIVLNRRHYVCYEEARRQLEFLEQVSNID